MFSALEAFSPTSATRLDSRPARLVTYWGMLAVLLLAEIIGLTLRFDAGAAARRTDWASCLLAATPDLLRIAVAMIAVTLALTAWRLRSRFGQVVREQKWVTGLWPWLPVHLLFFAWLAFVSAPVFAEQTQPGGLLVLAWFAAVSCTALSWAAAAAPPRFWPILVRNGWGVLAAGAAIGLAAWAAGRLARPLWESSAAPTFWAVSRILRVMTSEVISEPHQFLVGTPRFRVTIAPACSGYEGIGLVCLYLGAYLFLFRRDLHLRSAVWLLPVGALSAWLLNVVRIAGLILIGDAVSPQLALGGFHSQAGWLAFNAVALGLAMVAHRARLFVAVPSAGPNPTAAYLAPLLAIIAVQMVTEAAFNGAARYYPLRVAAGGLLLACYGRSIRSLERGQIDRSGVADGAGTWWAVPAGVGVFILWMLLAWLAPPKGSPATPQSQLAGLPGWALAAWVVSRAVGSIVVVPLAEELAFRGYLLRRLVAADFWTVSPRQLGWASLLISSGLFGLLHDRWLAGTLAGMVYAAVYCRRGRLSDAVLAHAVTNGLITAVAVASGNWDYWS